MLMQPPSRLARCALLSTLCGALVLGPLPGGPGAARAAWPPDWTYLQHDRGWHFYNEERPSPPVPPPPEPSDEPETPEPPQPEDTAPHPMSEIPTEGPALIQWLVQLPDTDLARLVPQAPASALRAWIPVLMDQALTTLDRISVRKYLLVQQESMRRSEKFSRIWQEVIWTDSGFDRPGAMPLGAIAHSVYDQETATREREGLASLRDSVSLLLVVQPDCRTCEVAWKILKDWGAQYQFTVRPIAAALLTLADGTAVLPYPQILEALQVTEFPSLYLIQPSTHYLTRLGTGILTEQELATRILRLIPEANPEGAVTHVSPPTAPAIPQPNP
jgi:hypothetical protein